MPSASWTGEEIDLLKKLWSEGLTAAAIAVRIGGLSRSAVLGKMHRLRLRTDKAAAASAAKAKFAGERCAETAPTRRRRKRRKPPAAPSAARRHKTLFELTNKTCRWRRCKQRKVDCTARPRFRRSVTAPECLEQRLLALHPYDG